MAAEAVLQSDLVARQVSALGTLDDRWGRLSLATSVCNPPRFFLAGLSKAWKPRILMVTDHGHPIGLLYAKERKVAGIATGLIHADCILGSFVVAAPQHAEQVLRAGIITLLEDPSVKGLRILTPDSGHETRLLTEIAAQRNAARRSLDTGFASFEHHAVIALPATYDAFIASLHHNTRHNFKRSRARSLEAGQKFCANIPINEFEKGVWHLEKQAVFGSDRAKLKVALNVFRAAPDPLLAGLQDADGSWLSLMGGWCQDNRCLITMQLKNHHRYPKFSTSLVTRSFAIENLIQRCIQELVFYANVSEPLHHYAVPMRMTRVYLDRRDLFWRLFRHAIQRHRGILRGWTSYMSEWIVPSRPAE
jgi:hypothetical protein